MSLGCPTLHRGFEIEPESMKWVIQHTNANMVETGFFETCSTSYANSTALVDNLVRMRITADKGARDRVSAKMFLICRRDFCFLPS